MAKKRYKATLLDYVGKQINVGDIIAYGKALGRCASLNVGVVLETWTPHTEDEIKNMSPWATECANRVTFMTNHDSWTSFVDRDPDKASNYNPNDKSTKKTTIKFSNRCMVISNPDDLGDSDLADTLREISTEVKNGLVL